MPTRSFFATFALLMLTSTPMTAQPYAVTFVIDMRQEIAAKRFDPAKDVVGVRSGWDPLSWDKTLPALDPDGDGRYEVKVAFPEKPFGGQPLNYKFKVDAPGKAPNDGWEDGKNYRLHLNDATQTLARRFGELSSPIQPVLTGIQKRHPGFKSRFLAPRDVIVYLPPGYDKETSRRYPVLYMHDGQNIFDATNMGMEWQMDESAEKLIAAGSIEPVIIVGVGNTEARIDEYSPTSVKRWDGDGMIGGKADLYGRLLIEELKPFIDKTYRTRPDARSTSLGGASLGGLVSLYLGLKHPDVFGGGLLVVSSAAAWDGQMIVKKVEALPARTPQRIWLDMGTREGEEALVAVHRLRDALAAKGWKLGADLRYLEVERGGHDELAWAPRVEPMLRFLYGKE
ncbi:MAG TPA: alpha/beta hydrolase-fold protein [Thermoanaerobaculia bacterium]